MLPPGLSIRVNYGFQAPLELRYKAVSKSIDLIGSYVDNRAREHNETLGLTSFSVKGWESKQQETSGLSFN